MNTILVTGAASGMGREITRRAVVRGEFVIACVLNEAEAARIEPAQNLHTVVMDVASNEAVVAGFAEAERLLGGRRLDRVIHCAGISPSGALEVDSIDNLEKVININTLGSARVLREALPRLRGHQGRIVLFSSLWGKVGGPMLSGYCASKHAIEAIVDCARRETHDQGLDIVLVEPGVIMTPLLDVSLEGARSAAGGLGPGHRAIYGPLYDSYARLIEREAPKGTTVEAAADVIEKAAFTPRPRTRYAIGKDAKGVIALSRLLSDRALDFVFRKMYGV